MNRVPAAADWLAFAMRMSHARPSLHVNGRTQLIRCLECDGSCACAL
jgi:hypothetical protein